MNNIQTAFLKATDGVDLKGIIYKTKNQILRRDIK